MFDYTPSEFSRFRVQSQQSKAAARRHRQPVLRPIHPDARRARRAQVLRRLTHEIHSEDCCVASLLASSRRRRWPRSTSSPPCPSGARSPTELGGDKVKVYIATNALQDPHHVEAKPSLIARARSADLVVATGAELEIGWLPLVLQQAGNPKIQPGKPGYFEAARVRDAARQADAPRSRRGRRPRRRAIRTSRPIRATSRASPRPLAARLAELDPANAAYYQARYKAFAERWSAAIARLGEAGGAAQGRRRSSSSTRRSPISIAWLGLKRSRRARAQARRRADDRAPVRGARDCCSGSRRRW